MSDELAGAVEVAIKVAETAGQVAKQVAERVASGVKNAELGAEGSRAEEELDGQAEQMGLVPGGPPDAVVPPQMQQNDAWPGTSPDLSTANTDDKPDAPSTSGPDAPDATSRPSGDETRPDGTGTNRSNTPENLGPGGDQPSMDRR